MTSEPITTPVLFLIFNRPDTTQRVFDEIKKTRPRVLFVSADGPREGMHDEAGQCQAARDIIKQVDWECEVHTNFHENNVGLKTAISSAIDWFFDHVDAGIILEDDCLPSQSFFWFCQNLLERYRNDERIMMITGSNFQFGRKRGDASYYFSQLAGIWGWATWKRAWKYFDPSMETFPRFKEQNQIKNILQDEISRIFWMTKIEQAYNSSSTWGFAWAYAMFTQNGLCVCPNENLVSNIGFGLGAVHATNATSIFANVKTTEMEEIIHPVFIMPDRNADEFGSKLATNEQLPYVRFGDRVKIMVKAIAGKIIPRKYHKRVREYLKRYMRYEAE